MARNIKGFGLYQRADEMLLLAVERIRLGLVAQGLHVVAGGGKGYLRVEVGNDEDGWDYGVSVEVKKVEIPMASSMLSDDVDDRGKQVWSRWYSDRVRVTVHRPGYGGGRNPWTNLPALVDDPIKTPNGQKVLTSIQEFIRLKLALEARSRERTNLDTAAKKIWADRPQAKPSMKVGVATLEVDRYNADAMRLNVGNIPAAAAAAVWAGVVATLESLADEAAWHVVCGECGTTYDDRNPAQPFKCGACGERLNQKPQEGVQ